MNTKKLHELFVALIINCLVFAFSGCITESNEENSEWEVVFQSGFEEVDSLTYPEEWWTLSAWGEWEWHLETDYAHAETIEYEGKGHVAKVIHDAGTNRSVIVACTGDEDIIQSKKRYLNYEFLVPEDALDNNHGIYIDIEQFNTWSEKGDHVGMVGFTPAGRVVSFYGYHPGPDSSAYQTIEFDAFTLHPNKWYTVQLEVDFAKERITFFSIHGPGVDRSWNLNNNFAYHANPFPDEWIAVAIYIGVRDLTEQEGMYALFDNVEFGVIK